MALSRELLADDSALGGAQDNVAPGGEGGGVNAGGERQDGGLEQKSPDDDQGDAILVSAEPTHRLC
jgi:hypothetical protein